LAKEKGLVESVAPMIEELLKAGYWLSDDVVQIARRLGGE